MVIKKSFSVFWSNNAKADLKNIFDYIKLDSPQNAASVIAGIVRLSKTFSHFPIRMEECRELPTKNKVYRKATYAPFKIICRVNGMRIEILTVFHSSRNPKKLSSVRKIKI